MKFEHRRFPLWDAVYRLARVSEQFIVIPVPDQVRHDENRDPHLGRLQADAEADISILRLEDGNFSFQDADNAVIEASQSLRVCGVVQGGEYRNLG